MTKRYRPIRIRAALAVSAVGILAGCASISESLKLDTTVLVKVPIDTPVAAGHGDGWEFRHVLEAPRDSERRGEWYVAWNNQRPLASDGILPHWNELFARAPEIADAAHTAFHAYAVLIEPNGTYGRLVAKEPPNPTPGDVVKSKYGDGVRLVINKNTSPAWANGREPDPQHPGQSLVDPMWYQDDQHSQLARARDQFDAPGDGISIGHLDNGLDGRHSAAPLRLVRGDGLADTVNLLQYAQARSKGEKPDPPLAPELTGGTHGMGTVGILAGGWVAIDQQKTANGTIKPYYGWLGGAPYARVVPVRVAPWVVSVSTAQLAYSIDYASRVKGCDVLTMSHGGSPTQAWVDAVNAAYERGTAMFAAESDFFSLVPDPFKPSGIILPSSPVYPAGFRRVMGVTGVTADYHSYARNSLWDFLRAPWGLVDWMSRGCYGADGTSTALLRPTRKPDPSQTWRQGELHPYPIAAYSPNIPWLSVREKSGQRIADGVDLNGSGTSASTPQVAAAAALWLQKHRGEFSSKQWHGWEKPEAVYYALLKTADRRGRIGPDPYLGAGLLRANDALNLGYAEIRKNRRPNEIGPESPAVPGSLWYEPAPNDYFDGARSFLGLLGLNSPRYVDINDRATLRERPQPGESRTAGLQRLYYNMLLLQQWHNGNIPRKREDTDRYWKRAGDIAAKVAAASPDS